MQIPPVKTPCIGVCSTGIGDAVCRGCKRFAHEVIHWNGYSQAEKRAVDDRLSRFLSQCVQQYLTVDDAQLLRWQLEVQQLRYNPDHDEYCQLYVLIKAGGSQIRDPATFGFRRQAAIGDTPLPAVRELIDEAFWALSQAHYERYILAPDLFSGNSQ